MSDQDLLPPHVAEPARATRTLDSLAEAFIRSGSRFTIDDFSASIRRELAVSPDPDMALTNLLRFTGASFQTTSLFNDLLQYPLYCSLLMKLFGFSQYFADVLVREPGLFRWLTVSEVLMSEVTESTMRPEIERVLGTFRKPERLLDALKRVHRRELLRIGARDIMGFADLDETTRQLSVLADAVIDAALRIAVDQLGEKYLALRDIPFCVIGLGKLGGGELNYSSDIDVMFIYRDEREEQPGGSPSAFEYFNRLSERLVRNLSQPSAEGHLYRVDTRLRPEAGAGPLARSLQSTLTYYESRGELWERQMLVKARPVAGDRHFGEQVLHQLEPFVYPRSFFEHPARSVARIKARIESAVGDEANIKLMAGGIRDIEFIVQTLQLVNGGKTLAVREPNTLRALALLATQGLLGANEYQTLWEAYTFYRTIEHRLQTMLNTQTHTLPTDSVALEALSRRVGMSSSGDLRRVLEERLGAVRRISRRVLAVEHEPSSSGILAVLDGGSDESAVSKALTALGFRDVRSTARIIRLLATGSGLAGGHELDTRGKESFRAVAPELFADILRTPDPDLTVQSLSFLAMAQKIPHLFYGQLLDPRFRKFILSLCAVSPRFARALGHEPLLLERLASDPDALALLSQDSPAPGEDLAGFKLRQELRAGVRYLLGFSDFDQLTGELSAVASAIVASSWSAASAKRGRTRFPLAVFALGKFGGAELGFDADLDLLFVAGQTESDGSPLLENAASDLLQALTAYTAGGRLYDADVRLRPEGRNAPLVVEAGAYGRYLATRASLWERQSLTRLRFIAGDSTVGNYVSALVAAWVYESPLPSGWTQEIISMRRKMETRSKTRRSTFLDVKLGAGGMADVEFVAQMLQLKHGGQRTELRGQKSTRLLRLTEIPLLPAPEGDLLGSAYAMYRQLELLMRIALEDRSSVLPEGEKLDRLARLYDGSAGAALEARVATTMRRVRQTFLEIAGRLA